NGEMHGGARKGAGRKTVDSVQITLRLKKKTLRKLRAEAERQKEPGRKRAEVGKVIDALVEVLPDALGRP
ncbi:MAG TPA: hypothetical protein VE242_14795, partial [Chthoniobacterales bacterium]|nr:hypothetical protein [Chthoniobacterales bacterium]